MPTPRFPILLLQSCCRILLLFLKSSMHPCLCLFCCSNSSSLCSFPFPCNQAPEGFACPQRSGETERPVPTPGTHRFMERGAWGRLARSRSGWWWEDPSRPGKVDGVGGWSVTPGFPSSWLCDLGKMLCFSALVFPSLQVPSSHGWGGGLDECIWRKCCV